MINEKTIFDTCPQLFYNRENNKYAIRYEIETPNGWFEPVFNLCKKLEGLISSLPPEVDRKEFVADQIKEKFGALRFYMDHSTEEMKIAIALANAICKNTCQDCGNDGATLTNINRWYRTLCKDCYEKRLNNYNMRRSLE
jgi:hypothetical protein